MRPSYEYFVWGYSKAIMLMKTTDKEVVAKKQTDSDDQFVIDFGRLLQKIMICWNG